MTPHQRFHKNTAKQMSSDPHSFFFLEYAGEFYIIALKRTQSIQCTENSQDSFTGKLNTCSFDFVKQAPKVQLSIKATACKVENIIKSTKQIYFSVLKRLQKMLVLEYVFRPMRLRPMWPMYGTYIATLLGLALINRISVHNIVYRWSTKSK